MAIGAASGVGAGGAAHCLVKESHLCSGGGTFYSGDAGPPPQIRTDPLNVLVSEFYRERARQIGGAIDMAPQGLQDAEGSAPAHPRVGGKRPFRNIDE